MLTVPFENLDIGLGREIVLDPERFIQKIVCERRGGFCYELNGAFATLLSAMGFRVTLLADAACRISRKTPARNSITLLCASILKSRGSQMSVLATTSSNRCVSSSRIEQQDAAGSSG